MKADAGIQGSGLEIRRYRRHFAVYDRDVLVCLCVYKKGAAEVVRRLTERAQKPRRTRPTDEAQLVFAF